MDKTWAVIKREYIERVRSKWFVIATLFGPLLLAAMMIVPAWLSLRSGGIADLSETVIVDASGAGLGDRLADALSTGSARMRARPEVRIVNPGDVSQAESLLTRDVMLRRYSGYLVVDRETLAGERARYAGRAATSLPAIDRLRTTVRNVVMAARLETVGVDPEVARNMTLLPLRLESERITERGRGGSGRVNAIFSFGLAFLLYMSLLLYGQAIMRGVMEEKQSRVAEVIISSVRPDALLAGKVLGVGGVAFTQITVWVAAGWLMATFRAPVFAAMGLPATPMQLPELSLTFGLLLLLLFALGFVFYSALFAAVGSMVNTDQEAQQAATPLMMLVIFAALFIQPVLFNPSGTLAQWVSLLPFSAPILMPIRLATVQVPWTEIIACLVVLALSCFIAVWLAARIYRVGLLMYGKKPTLREVAHWVRYA
ncbi:MAG TPA: ABC transporter permease [Gemmatimonadaceae bacterium]|nr:ABC transporter permease [Gemmatimonadaceae bacterium]